MKIIEISPSTRQVAWGWPAVFNFFLGGAGAGLYLFSFAEVVLQDEPQAFSKALSFEIVGPLVVVLGLLSLTAEAGRPAKGVYLLRGLQHAWLSRETLFAIIFVASAIIDWLILLPFFRMVAIFSGFAFMMSQGHILYQIRAIRSWNMWIVPFFFLSSGFASGGGVFLSIAEIWNIPVTLSTMALSIFSTGLNLAVWLVYLYMANPGILRKDKKKFQGISSLITIVGMGHVFSLCALLSLTIVTANAISFTADLLTAASGLIILGAIIGQKAALILFISHRKEITICVS